jgi:hypothetical protein
MISKGYLHASGTPVHQQEVLQLLSRFFRNPWFRRVWVLQEVWSARAEVIAWCGHNAIFPWQEIEFADRYVVVGFYYLKTRFQALPSPWNRFKKSAGPQGVSFQRSKILDLFTAVCQDFSSTDPRDKLFGLLAMGQQTFDISRLPALVCPDYTRPPVMSTLISRDGASSAIGLSTSSDT